jgi:hypothetical protein
MRAAFSSALAYCRKPGKAKRKEQARMHGTRYEDDTNPGARSFLRSKMRRSPMLNMTINLVTEHFWNHEIQDMVSESETH